MNGVTLTPYTVRTDSKVATALAPDKQVSARTSHIGLRFFFVKEEVDQKAVTFERVPSRDNHADMLTKFLDLQTMNHLVEIFRLR